MRLLLQPESVTVAASSSPRATKDAEEAAAAETWNGIVESILKTRRTEESSVLLQEEPQLLRLQRDLANETSYKIQKINNGMPTRKHEGHSNRWTLAACSQ